MRRIVCAIIVAVSAIFVVGCGEAAPPKSDAELAIEMHFGPYGPEVVEQAKRVAMCESTMNPGVTNGQYIGLFQMGSYHYWRFEGNNGYDPYVNARAAGGLWLERGWQPWECKP